MNAITASLQNIHRFILSVGQSIFFLGDILKVICSGRVRMSQVLEQMYFQGVQSVLIVMMASLATGVVLGLQGAITLQRFGAFFAA
jgi:ABC-type transporter Mla maintaining outer membrane lipid asymmetry permease subunit MlaE